jgi:hypothetical protein
MVEDAVVVELKSVETVLPLHRAQVLTYLRQTDKELAPLINFDLDTLVLGVDRIVNRFGLPRSLQSSSLSINTNEPQEFQTLRLCSSASCVSGNLENSDGIHRRSRSSTSTI